MNVEDVRANNNIVSQHMAEWTNRNDDKTEDVRINVTLGCVRVTTVAMEKQGLLNIVSVCLYSCLRYPTSKAHVRS